MWKHNGHLIYYFSPTSALMQGEVISPTLFSLYINDFEMHFIRENCPSVEIQLIKLFLLMYADDTVLISESAESFQRMLNARLSYTIQWNLTVYIDKTKILVLRNGKKLIGHMEWTYNEKNIEVVDQFNYFGEKEGDLTHSYDKTPYTNRKFENQRTTHKRHLKLRLHNNCGPT